jgi:PIN domain nuclease of toxin-antitoxin system
MIKLLLDTPILLWSLLDPDKIKSNVAVELENPDNSLWISPITTLEIIVLAEKKRIILDDDPDVWMREVIDTFLFSQATINREVAIKSRTIKLPHQDPVDRFIAASAMVYDLTLVTADKHLISNAKDYQVLPNL